MTSVCLDVIRIKIYHIDYVIEKVERPTFGIEFSHLTYLYTNMIISIELLIHVS